MPKKLGRLYMLSIYLYFSFPLIVPKRIFPAVHSTSLANFKDTYNLAKDLKLSHSKTKKRLAYSTLMFKTANIF